MEYSAFWNAITVAEPRRVEINRLFRKKCELLHEFQLESQETRFKMKAHTGGHTHVRYAKNIGTLVSRHIPKTTSSQPRPENHLTPTLIGFTTTIHVNKPGRFGGDIISRYYDGRLEGRVHGFFLAQQKVIGLSFSERRFFIFWRIAVLLLLPFRGLPVTWRPAAFGRRYKKYIERAESWS